MLRAKVKDILEAAQVNINEDQDPIEVWEGWIDFGESTWDGNTIEDAVPLSNSVLTTIIALLISSWNLPFVILEAQDILFGDANVVKSTTWLRHIMDLHVDEEKSFSQLLLMNDLTSGLLEALFHHLGMLHQLQHGVNQYSLTSPRTLGSVTSRLEHFQQIQLVTQKLQTELDNHIIRLEHIIGEFYSVGHVALRTQCRRLLGQFWYNFIRTSEGKSSGVKENTTATGQSMTLRILLRILQGVSPPFHSSYRHLLFYILIPFHRPSSMVLWRDQTAILDLYHEPLVKCIALLLKGQPEWKAQTIRSLLSNNIWPQAKGGSNGSNTPKIVLLLHEISAIINLPGEIDEPTWDALMARVVVCIASDNSRVAEQSLQLFRNKNFKELFVAHLATSLPLLLQATIKTDLPWNPTVRKMTYYVLSDLYKHYEIAFATACRTAFAGGGIHQSNATSSAPSTPGSAFKSAPVETFEPDFSLKASMGNWKPPTQTSRPVKHSMLPPPIRPPKSNNPPSSITGVAPWSKSNGRDPPVTITGVAPWASQASGVKQVSASLKIPLVTMDEGEQVLSHAENSGLGKVLAYIEELKPIEDEIDGTSSWAKIQMAESPTIFPSLKFHDLVFGHDLGSGAFGTVRYARLIDRTKTRSHWPEYAVKIVSTTKIIELGYAQSINREIATLRVLSHPGIARLVSSFRFKDGAYLVLEYASRGDLHSLLQTSGSLNNESTKFVIGEIVAALSSIHDAGFVYGDLKPENILITEPGHIKVTDFGACRPFTKAAREFIGGRTKNIINELRDGGWKPTNVNSASEKPNEAVSDWSSGIIEESSEVCDKDIIVHDDNRIEGTTAYLPPEVVMGDIPTPAADVWALGCVLYQCLTGRPPLLEVDEDSTKRKIVHFDATAHDQHDHLFSESHAKEITFKAQELIRRSLSRNAMDRPSMHQAADDDFFDGINVFTLYQKQSHPLDAGAVQPEADAQWARRQFSSIWAPLPKSYDMTMPVDGDSTALLDPHTAPISEGDEASSFFSIQSVKTLGEN